MQAGKLRHRVKLMANDGQTQDSTGQPVSKWVIESVLWAEVRPLQGTELYRAQQVQPELTHAVRTRYTARLTPAKRIQLGTDRTLEILSVLNLDERGAEMEALCKEVI